MAKGRVKWFNNQKGFGFIIADDDPSAGDVFVHYSMIQGEGYKTLMAGEEVDFELINGEKGAQARNVVKMQPAIH